MRILVICLVILGVIGGGAYWALSSRDYVFRFSENDLREHLDAQLPYEGLHLYIFDVALDNPRIDLVDGADRVAGGVDVVVATSFAGRELSFSGAADMSGGVRYDPDERSFFLKDPVVEKLRLGGVPGSYANKANEAISVALREFYRTRPLYVLEPDSAAKSAAHLFLKDVAVKDEQLVVRLGLNKSAAERAD